MFGGSPRALAWFNALYWTYFYHYLDAGLFVGKDQTMWTALMYLYPKRCAPLPPSRPPLTYARRFITVWANDPQTMPGKNRGEGAGDCGGWCAFPPLAFRAGADGTREVGLLRVLARASARAARDGGGVLRGAAVQAHSRAVRVRLVETYIGVVVESAAAELEGRPAARVRIWGRVVACVLSRVTIWGRTIVWTDSLDSSS